MIKSIFSLPTQLHVSSAMRNNGLRTRVPLLQTTNVARQQAVDSKPREALWTSTYSPEFGSEWVLWCKDNKPNWLKHSRDEIGFFYQLTMREPKKIAEIDSVDAAVEFTGRFGSFYKSEGTNKHYCEGIRWLDVLEEFDAVHLAASMPKNIVLFTYPQGVDISWIDGWDIESTAWFSWVFNEPEIIEPNLRWF